MAMLAAVIEFLSGLLYGTGDLAAETRRGRVLVIVAMAIIVAAGLALLLLAVT